LRGGGAVVDSASKFNWTPLLGGVFTGDIKLVRYLVENGADVNVRSVQGITPLWAAAAKGFLDKVGNIVL
jgi:ankyrin repeat protein